VQPTLVTAASGFVEVGGQIFDNANLLGANNPTGTITFDLYGPDNPTCAGPPVFSSTVPVTGTSVNSQPFTATQAGTYRWVATYSGDANNLPAGPTACGDPAETVQVTRAQAVLSTVASPHSGGVIFDTATLAGGFNPTGTITFDLHGPGDTFCSAAPIFTSTVPVNGNGQYQSGSFSPTVVGTYRWRATYSGDANNLGEGPTPCLDPAETVDVTSVGPGPGPTTPTLTTTASPGVAVGGVVSDTATLAGGNNPTGTITFSLFGPADATCAGPPVFTSTVPVNGNGQYQSGPFTPTTAGTYRWQATYSGDANNNPVGPTACGDPAETVVVTAAPGPTTPTLTTTASPGVAVGGPSSTPPPWPAATTPPPARSPSTSSGQPTRPAPYRPSSPPPSLSTATASTSRAPSRPPPPAPTAGRPPTAATPTTPLPARPPAATRPRRWW
jgi:hypothetical protein